MSHQEIEAGARNGAVALLETAVASGIEVCFANPGTTEMPLVQAFDDVPGLRPILNLFEGVCSGAADGYGRMTGMPAMTLTHLGPGFANSIANLHNARRARTPIVNIIGDHASWHLAYDAPLTSDIASLARPVSAHLDAVRSADELVEKATEACAAAKECPGSIATLTVPVDFQMAPATAPLMSHSPVAAPRHRPMVPPRRIDDLARRLRGGGRIALFLGSHGLTREAQMQAARVAAILGATVIAETFPARMEYGGGLPVVSRLPYFPEPAIKALEAFQHVVLVGALVPVAFFGYEGVPSELAPAGSTVMLATPSENSAVALETLAAAILTERVAVSPFVPAIRPVWTGDNRLDADSVGATVAEMLPDSAIVMMEGGTLAAPFARHATAHGSYTGMYLTGGAIGQGLPAVCPGRRDRVPGPQGRGAAVGWLGLVHAAVALVHGPRRYGRLRRHCSQSALPDSQDRTGSPRRQADTGTRIRSDRTPAPRDPLGRSGTGTRRRCSACRRRGGHEEGPAAWHWRERTLPDRSASSLMAW